MHSKYIAGDVFGFEFLNTGALIRRSMEMIAEEGKGVIVYLQTKGKGLEGALMTYPRVDGKRKRDFNPSFVYRADFKEYGIGAQILRDLGVGKMRLITNKPRHLVGLSGYGLEITESVPFPEELTSSGA